MLSPDQETAATREPPPLFDAGPRLSFAKAACLLCALLGLVVLCGWLVDAPLLRSVLPGAVQMKANTAIGLLLCAAALLTDARIRFTASSGPSSLDVATVESALGSVARAAGSRMCWRRWWHC